MDRQSSRKKRGCLVRLLFSKFVWVVIFLGLAVFWCARIIDPTLEEHADSLALALEATYRQMTGGNKYSGGSVELSPELVEVAMKEGADIEVVRELIAAAVNKGIEPHHLLGLAKIESSYCKNIGQGVAYDEVLKRLQDAIDRGLGEATILWWSQQLKALRDLADELGIDVMEIPGSVGAGAISCLQLMPGNWQVMGGGDFRQPYYAGMNGAEFLLRHKYREEGFAEAVKAYNPNAGQPYIDSVLAAAAIWEPVTGDIILYEGIDVPWWVLFLENLAWFMEGGEGMPPWVEPPPGNGLPPPIIDGIANPYPGSSTCGNWYERRIGSYIHYGQDFCLAGYVSGPSYAAIDCKVTVAKLINRHNWEAITWSASGYTVVCEGATEDGQKIETIYGHLKPDSMPQVGDVLAAGDFMANTGCLGNPDVELCSGDHLHFGVKIDGTWYNPNDFLKRTLEALLRILRSL